MIYWKPLTADTMTQWKPVPEYLIQFPLSTVFVVVRRHAPQMREPTLLLYVSKRAQYEPCARMTWLLPRVGRQGQAGKC
jgi:hypothetical protein